MQPGGRHFRKSGQYTDDTLQALAVAESLLVCRGFDPSDLIQRLLVGYKKASGMVRPNLFCIL